MDEIPEQPRAAEVIIDLIIRDYRISDRAIRDHLKANGIELSSLTRRSLAASTRASLRFLAERGYVDLSEMTPESDDSDE